MEVEKIYLIGTKFGVGMLNANSKFSYDNLEGEDFNKLEKRKIKITKSEKENIFVLLKSFFFSF